MATKWPQVIDLCCDIKLAEERVTTEQHPNGYNHMQCCCQCLRIILITLMILMDLMGLKALMTLMDLMELISLILLIDLQARLIVMKVTR